MDIFAKITQSFDQQLSKIDNVTRDKQPRENKTNVIIQHDPPKFIKTLADRQYTPHNLRIIEPRQIEKKIDVIEETVTCNINGQLITLPREMVTAKILELIRENKKHIVGDLSLLDAGKYFVINTVVIAKTATIKAKKTRKGGFEQATFGNPENERYCQYKPSKNIRQSFQQATIDQITLIKVDNKPILSKITVRSGYIVENYNKRNITIDKINNDVSYFEKVSKENKLAQYRDNNGYLHLKLRLDQYGNIIASVQGTVLSVVLGQYKVIKLTVSKHGLTVLDNMIIFQWQNNTLDNVINLDRMLNNLNKIIPNIVAMLPQGKELDDKRKKDLKICKNNLRKILTDLNFDIDKVNTRLTNTINFKESQLIALLLDHFDTTSLVWLKQWLLAVRHNPHGYLQDLAVLTRYIV